MPIEMFGQRFYITSEMCRKTNISRSTLSRWLRQGIIKKLHKDRRGWNLFTEDDLNKIRAEAQKIEVEDIPSKIKSAGKSH